MDSAFDGFSSKLEAGSQRFLAYKNDLQNLYVLWNFRQDRVFELSLKAERSSISKASSRFIHKLSP
jgi:hypothetical protein